MACPPYRTEAGFTRSPEQPTFLTASGSYRHGTVPRPATRRAALLHAPGLQQDAWGSASLPPCKDPSQLVTLPHPSDGGTSRCATHQGQLREQMFPKLRDKPRTGPPRRP